ncbi:hypothetical protein SeMB42_g01387 [Synchytrium endobioticum]|uniref:Reelin domain-containing protein n=1 Tax=Synchytrium endobioticum TaxID=286115 RepID=A0A507DLS3_9FUNG|nr:hypothetical protein SeLEV6574_g00999 [Synchytrium endobioticum]TPX52466.1 hypothetical protein SeMB42_g01387 [Synchytrium endobioticum]
MSTTLHCFCIWILVAFLASHVRAKPSGAPFCDPEKPPAILTKVHGAASDLGTYTIASNAISYTPGSPVTLTLSGGAIAGLLLGVHDAQLKYMKVDVPKTGSFAQCTAGNDGGEGLSITHSKANTETTLSITFTPPVGTKGDLTVSAIIMSGGLGKPWEKTALTIPLGGARSAIGSTQRPTATSSIIEKLKGETTAPSKTTLTHVPPKGTEAIILLLLFVLLVTCGTPHAAPPEEAEDSRAWSYSLAYCLFK